MAVPMSIRISLEIVKKLFEAPAVQEHQVYLAKGLFCFCKWPLVCDAKMRKFSKGTKPDKASKPTNLPQNCQKQGLKLPCGTSPQPFRPSNPPRGTFQRKNSPILAKIAKTQAPSSHPSRTNWRKRDCDRKSALAEGGQHTHTLTARQPLAGGERPSKTIN
jgi:hypothetical protein